MIVNDEYTAWFTAMIADASRGEAALQYPYTIGAIKGVLVSGTPDATKVREIAELIVILEDARAGFARELEMERRGAHTPLVTPPRQAVVIDRKAS